MLFEKGGIKMSKKIDRMIENDFNKSYQPNVCVDQIMSNIHTEDIKVVFKPKLVWLKHLAKAFVIIIVIGLVFVGCLGVKQYTTERKEFATSIQGVKVIDREYMGLSDADLAKLLRAYDDFHDIPILVVYHFDDIRIFIYFAQKRNSDNTMDIDYFCLIEYAENNTDQTSILIDGKEVLITQERTLQMIASKHLESPDSSSQLEFEVKYRGESRKEVARKN